MPLEKAVRKVFKYKTNTLLTAAAITIAHRAKAAKRRESLQQKSEPLTE